MKENNLKEIQWLISEKYKGKRTAEAEKDIARLEHGEHIDYVIGWVNFVNCKIDLSLKPLIPRPETEFWTKQVISELQKRSLKNRAPYSSLHSEPRPNPTISQAPFPSLRVLDLFSGSGCIGVAVLKHVPNVYVDFAEKDKVLLEQIQLNAELNEINKKRYSILQSDIFSGVKDKYDYILANPPYVPFAQKKKVQKSVLDQEPHNAVFGGEDGLFYIREFLQNVKKFLADGAVVYLEFDSPQKEAIENLAKDAGATTIEIHKDQFNKWRYARIVF